MTTVKNTEPEKDDLDSYAVPENRAKTPWATWPEPGRQYAGVLVDRKIVPNTMKQDVNPNAKQEVYTLADAKIRNADGEAWEPIEGGIVNIAGRRGEPGILMGMHNWKLGTIVVVKYDELVKSKSPTKKDAKYVNAYTKKVINQEVLDSYSGIPSGDDLKPLSF